jgi:hypothetical protein
MLYPSPCKEMGVSGLKIKVIGRLRLLGLSYLHHRAQGIGFRTAAKFSFESTGPFAVYQVTVTTDTGAKHSNNILGRYIPFINKN